MSTQDLDQGNIFSVIRNGLRGEGQSGLASRIQGQFLILDKPQFPKQLTWPFFFYAGIKECQLPLPLPFSRDKRVPAYGFIDLFCIWQQNKICQPNNSNRQKEKKIERKERSTTPNTKKTQQKIENQRK
jgi:hypothetical protein